MKSEIKQSALIGIERAVVCTVGYSVWNESDRLLAEDNLFSDRSSLTPVRQVLSFHRINSRRRVAPRFTVCRSVHRQGGNFMAGFSRNLEYTTRSLRRNRICNPKYGFVRSVCTPMEKVLIKTDFEKIENWSQDRKMFKFLLLLFLTLGSDLIIGKWRARKVKCLNRKKKYSKYLTGWI